ncbi:hypothetical protein [Bacillus sp. CHD6a]|uniref:hypothetical protein n=1 Tax=Bacillus sp. CHD6a TaxID=1643452 RepID=UPI0006CD49A9|nr:hypothetical protein [Bacillus sp. CHD6a]KPB05940.1 hypothetical protein AAV98_03150 [Bacillus sp. CHD6a]
MQKRATILGSLFFLLSAIPLVAFLTSWGSTMVELFNRVTLFIPIAFGVVGLLVTLFRVKGWPKGWLIAANSLSVCGWALLLFIAIYGFQAP